MSEKFWLAEENFILDYEQQRLDFMSKDIKPEMFLDVMSRNKNSIMSIDGNKATINIIGILSKSGPDFIDMILGFGGTSYDAITNALDEIEDDESIENVDLMMNTPGGEAIPVDSVWQKIFSLRSKKKITAINTGDMASAGYYLGSAAETIKAESPLVMFGSIGTIVTTIKKSEYDRRVEIVSKNAPKKRPDVSTKKGRAIYQDMVDALERTFISRVASGRGISEDDVIKNFGQGSMMVAKDFGIDKPDAIKNGMADGFIDNALIEVKSKKRKFKMESTPYNKEIIDNIDSQKEIDLTQATSDHKTTANNPAANTAGKNIQEDFKMSLKDYLAQNPAEKIEYDNAIAESKKAGIDEGKAEMNGIMSKCAVYVGSEDYKGIESQVQKVLKGESDISSLEGAVTAFDMMNEQKKETTAKADTKDQGETKTETDSKKSPEEEYEARKQRIKVV